MDFLFAASNARKRRAALPWETGLVGQILNRNRFPLATTDAFLRPTWDPAFLSAAGKNMSDIQVAKVPDKVVVKSGPVAGTLGPAFTLVSRKRPTVPWTIKVTDDRKVAMERWKILLSHNPSGTLVGRQLLKFVGDPCMTERVDRLLSDTFAAKATSTLEQRAGSLLCYGRWLTANDVDVNIFPFCEDAIYSYLTSLQTSGAAATKAQRFRESVAFAYGMVGADGGEQAVTSKRCYGAAFKSLTTKGTYTQRDPLLALQLGAFERGVFDLPSDADKVMSGNACALAHWRARFSDVYFCRGEPMLDEVGDLPGYIELAVQDTKVSRKDKRRRCLPLVGHSRGLLDKPWAREWIALRTKLKLDCTGGPLLTAVNVGGSFTSARLRSSEAVVWFREILRQMGAPCNPSMLFGTHSMKATLLSWSAKAGVSMSHRTILGYHASGSAETAILYSRDALAGPLRSLYRVLTHVREKRFLPDSTRSGRWEVTGSEDDIVPSSSRDDTDKRPFDLHSAGSSSAVEGHKVKEVDIAIVSQEVITAVQNPSLVEQLTTPVLAVPTPLSEIFYAPGSPARSVHLEGSYVALDMLDDENEQCSDSPRNFRCSGCNLSHKSIRTVWNCEQCMSGGCSHCMPVYNFESKIVCYTCHNDVDDGFGTRAEIIEDLSSGSDDSESSCSDSSLENGEYDRAAETFAQRSTGRFPARNAGEDIAQHKVSRTLHLVKQFVSDKQLLACGRQLNEAYEVLACIPVFEWPKCKVCFGSKSSDDHAA